MVLPDTGTEGAISVAERLRQEVESARFPGHDGEFDARLTMSLGVATFPHDGTEIDMLIEFADRGLYAAKRNGKNQVNRIEAVYAKLTQIGA